MYCLLKVFLFFSTDEVQSKLQKYDRELTIHKVMLAETEMKFRIMEAASYDGVLLWKISEYQRRKRDALKGRTLSLYSQPFFSSRHGYKMCARAYLNGDGMGKGTHLSLFFVVMRGEYDNLLTWPFKQNVTMTLLDQEFGERHLSDTFRPDPLSSSFRKPVTELNVASGLPMFAACSVADQPPYNIDDSVFIKVAVDNCDLPSI